MAQYEVSILEKHPSCGSEQANKKSLRKHAGLAVHPTLLRVEMAHGGDWRKGGEAQWPRGFLCLGSCVNL